MLIPHYSLRSFQLQFSLSFIFFMVFFWTGLTSWATWAVVSNVDYWSMKVNHEVMKMKLNYFVLELKKSRQILEQVKEADIQLRHLLGMKSKKFIIEEEEKGRGGPEPFERSILEKELSKRLWDINEEEIRLESGIILKESQKRLDSYKEIVESIAYQRGLYRSTPRGWPAAGRITSRFGDRVSPLSGEEQFHTGIDIANTRGTPILATAEGIVRLADWEGGYGRLVVIDHGFGYVTYYGHNSEICVGVGQKVKRGQVIAYMGSSGSSTGDHTHYEVILNGRCINPAKYLGAGSLVDDMSLARRLEQ